MRDKDYRKAILDGLLKKYNVRYAKNITTNRRIILKPAEIYKDYAKNEAVCELSGMGFIAVDHLKYSDDIEKIYLSEERIGAIYEYLKNEYGVVPRSILSEQICEIVKKYTGMGGIVQKYCEGVLAHAEEPGCPLIPERVGANLKMIDFLERNKEALQIGIRQSS